MSLLKNTAIFTTTLTLSTIMMSSTLAADLTIDAPDCGSSYGSIYVDRGANAAVWQSVKTGDPANFVAAMLAESGCFTIAKSAASASYIMTAGQLTKEQFEQGVVPFQQQGIPGATPGAGLEGVQSVNKSLGKANDVLAKSVNSEGKLDVGKFAGLVGGLFGGSMRHGYLQINDTKVGRIIGLGFGRNNRADVSYSHWSNIDATQKNAIQSFNKDKTSKVVGGTLVNAYFDLFEDMPSLFNGSKTNMANAATSASPAAAASSSSMTTMTVNQLVEIKAKNTNVFSRDYEGKSVTVSGKLDREAGRTAYHWGLLVADSSAKRRLMTPSQGVFCGLLGHQANKKEAGTGLKSSVKQEALKKRYLYMDPGTELTIRGTVALTGIAQHEIVLEDCTVLTH